MRTRCGFSGQLADAAQDDEKATQLMGAAAHLSLHESVALDWLLRKSIDQRDYERAIYYADALLRTRPELAASVVPELAEMTEDEGAVQILEGRLPQIHHGAINSSRLLAGERDRHANPVSPAGVAQEQFRATDRGSRSVIIWTF